MIKIGITGNIACGKSTASEIIKSAGYPIIDCDDIVKELYCNKLFVEQAEKEFPSIISKGKINPKKLSGLLFTDSNFKVKYEAFIFPKVKEKILDFFENSQSAGRTHEPDNKNIIFVIAPMLFEAGIGDMFDKIIFISADENIRKERLISRKSMLSEIADKVIKSQISEEEKIPRCDFVIENNGTLEEFRNAVNEILNDIII